LKSTYWIDTSKLLADWGSGGKRQSRFRPGPRTFVPPPPAWAACLSQVRLALARCDKLRKRLARSRRWAEVAGPNSARIRREPVRLAALQSAGYQGKLTIRQLGCTTARLLARVEFQSRWL